MRPRRGGRSRSSRRWRRAPAAGGVPGPADARPLPRRAAGRRPPGVPASTAGCWPRSSASTRRPRCRSSKRRILAHDPGAAARPARRASRCAGTGWASGSAPGATAPCSPPACPGVDRELAIRVLRQEIADDPEFVRTFEATAHRVASLRHPAIVADPRLLARAGRGVRRDAPPARRDAPRPPRARAARPPPRWRRWWPGRRGARHGRGRAGSCTGG